MHEDQLDGQAAFPQMARHECGNPTASAESTDDHFPAGGHFLDFACEHAGERRLIVALLIA